MLTALANDVGFDVVFARTLAAAARAGDIAFGLSTSGSSENVVRGLAAARERGLLTVGTAGYAGGAMAEAAARGQIDHMFVVPSASVHRIQEAQTTMYHVLWELVQHAWPVSDRQARDGARPHAHPGRGHRAGRRVPAVRARAGGASSGWPGSSATTSAACSIEAEGAGRGVGGVRGRAAATGRRRWPW